MLSVDNPMLLLDQYQQNKNENNLELEHVQLQHMLDQNQHQNIVVLLNMQQLMLIHLIHIQI
jgi:hypothetical protein